MKTRVEKKKLTIKPFASTPTLPPDFEEHAWDRLQRAVEAVIAEKAIDISKEELYRDVEVLCLHKLNSSLYNKLHAIITSHSYASVDSLQNQTADPSLFLDHVSVTWLQYSTHLSTIRNIFLYLDRNYDYASNSTSSPPPTSLIDVGFFLFRDRLLQLNKVHAKVMSCILMLIQAERAGSTINTETVSKVVKMLNTLNLYTTFEDLLVSESEKFFTCEASSVSSNDLNSYLIYAEGRFLEAATATTTYLLNTTRHKLYAVLENTLLKPHLLAMITRGASTIFQRGVVVEIRRLYVMCERVLALISLRVNGSRQCGEPIVAPADPSQEKSTIIEELLQLQDKAENILRDAFANKDTFRFAYRSAMEHVINLRSMRLAQLLGVAIDKLLRSKDDDVEEKLEQLLRLFRYLHGKDAFEAFYRQMLAKRLLLGKSASADNEKFMILALKTECGADYSSKLEGMLKDMELSREVITTYKQSASQAVSDIDTDIHVLTTGFWPSFPAVDTLILPKIILKHKEYFNEYYVERYKGRRLTWQHTLDRVILTAHFAKGKREFELSLLQAMVLLAFNDVAKATYDELQHMTGIPMDELKLVLLSLSGGPPSHRVLQKQPKTKELNPSDCFNVDAAYTNKLYRVKINTLQLKESAQETEKTHEEIFRDRQHQVDAVIVRLMKARKRLSHNDLMSEVMAQLRFAALSSDIKRRIESLIERDYLERDRDDNTVYNYLA